MYVNFLSFYPLTNKIGSRKPPAFPNCENIMEIVVETTLSSFGNQLALILVHMLTTNGIVIDVMVYPTTRYQKFSWQNPLTKHPKN